MKKWEIEEGKKPKKERRPMPQPPKQLVQVLDKINTGGGVNWDELETYNQKANDEYNEKALIYCGFCNRTFLPERLSIHQKICTAEKPFKPLPPPANRGEKALSSTNTSTSTTTTSKSMASKGGNSSYGGGNSSYGGGSQEKPLGKKPMGNAYKGNQYQEEEEEYVSPKPTQKKVVPGGKPSYTAKQHEEEEEEEEEEVYKPQKPIQSKPMSQARNQNYGTSHMGDEHEEIELVKCDICDRNFAADRLDRHMKACVKVQKADAKHAKKVALAEKKQLETEKFIAKQAKYKKNNWREQHKEFIENLRYNRKLQAVEDKGGDVRALGPPPKMSAIEQNFVECPYCYRKFNPTSAEKHINICKNVVNKPKAVPGKSLPSSTRNSQPSYGSPQKPLNSTKTNNFRSPGGVSTSSSYGRGSFGSPQDDDYNPNNYGGGMNKQSGFGSARPMGTTQMGSMPKSPNGMAQYGSPLNTTKGGGFGMKPGQKTSSSSLANAGKMAMQTTYSSYNQSTQKSGKPMGYRY